MQRGLDEMEKDSEETEEEPDQNETAFLGGLMKNTKGMKIKQNKDIKPSFYYYKR